MYSRTTRALRITVRPLFLEDQSEPEEDAYVWAYQVIIDNEGAETVQLLRRHWIITDATGLVQEVEGEGVVGEQPVLKPGAAFQYTSGCPLNTPSGFMHGTYTFRVTDTEETFEAIIPMFSLDSPHGVGTVH